MEIRAIGRVGRHSWVLLEYPISGRNGPDERAGRSRMKLTGHWRIYFKHEHLHLHLTIDTNLFIKQDIGTKVQFR